MLEAILPQAVTVVSTRGDIDVDLFPEEERVVANAVERRRREFTTARACARAALEQLGIGPQPIPTGERGAPGWPSGIVGSITHCEGYRACAVGRVADVAAIGIDAEPNHPLPDGVFADIALPEERDRLGDLSRVTPDVHWDRLLFCIKESIYKAWFPLAERWLGFEDALVAISKEGGIFSAQLLVSGPRYGDGELTRLAGRWIAHDGIVAAAIALPASGEKS